MSRPASSGRDKGPREEDRGTHTANATIATTVALAALATAAGAATEPECAATYNWARAAFLGEAPADTAAVLGLELRRQDHGIFGRNRSSRDTAPLQLGQKRHEHGLGTHSVSEIVVHLDKPGARFEVEVGIDNNWDTRGERGSVVFVVEVADKEAFRSGVRRGSDAPLPVSVDLRSAKQFTLRVLDAGDGPSWDQADWANASVTFEDGASVYLGQLPDVTAGTLSTSSPFSFIYGGEPSAQLLSGWRRSVGKADKSMGRERHVVTYTDPLTGLEAVCELTLFSGYPAVEWVLRFCNRGKQDTPMLERIMPLDMGICPVTNADAVLHHANGSSAVPQDFQPLADRVSRGRRLALAPVGGRSSNGQFPFFNLQWGDDGLVGAIGWSGQWELRVERNASGPIALQAGQHGTHLKLHPGETIRTPRILLVRWQGDRMRGHNMLRRLICQFYTPLLAGGKPLPPTQCNTWFPVKTGVNANEKNQIELIEAYGLLGIEYVVMDAGWYGTTKMDWPVQVGTWTPRPDAFPRGLKPLGEAAKRAGVRFGMWFEPERVRPDTLLDKEHPEWLIKIDGQANRLLNLGLPQVQDWLIEMVSRYVDEVPLGYFRQDFNMNPLEYWQHADAADRRGITEIRYIEGMYRVWDELHARYPDMMIEGCASGGRRIDLESISRCHTYWASDLFFNSMGSQAHIHGASLYLPGNYLNIPMRDLSKNPYAFRSVFGGALCASWDPREPGCDRDLAKARVQEFMAVRHLAVGDFYPLLPHSSDQAHWNAYQFHRADLAEGMALVFRSSASLYLAAEIKLRGLDPKQTYEVRFVDSRETRRMTGEELGQPMRVEIEKSPGSFMIRYRAMPT